VLQEGEFSRVGENRTARVNVRVIAATNKNLARAVKRGAFREDLYYRLNVINIHIPPLKERLEDIPELVSHFIARFNEKFSKSIEGISPDALSVFSLYEWPGNVRELENLMERTVIFCDEAVVQRQHLQEPLKSLLKSLKPEENTGDLTSRIYKDAKNIIVRKFNENYIKELVRKSGGNISEAARRSGLDRSVIYRLIRKYDVLIGEGKTDEE